MNLEVKKEKILLPTFTSPPTYIFPFQFINVLDFYLYNYAFDISSKYKSVRHSSILLIWTWKYSFQWEKNEQKKEKNFLPLTLF